MAVVVRIVGKVDAHKVLRMCEDRRVQVDISEASYVCFERVQDPSELYFNKSVRQWLEDLNWCTSRARFEVSCHLDDHDVPPQIRAFQGRCAPSMVSPSWLRQTEIPENWKRDIHHVVIQREKGNMIRNGLIAEGLSAKPRGHATYFSAAYTFLDNSQTKPRFYGSTDRSIPSPKAVSPRLLPLLRECISHEVGV